MTPKEANILFKEKINECLSLLGSFGPEEKEDVWKFWKTVSAAVKIAVNGRGDAIYSSRKKARVPRSTHEAYRNIELDHIQKVDKDAISVYIPGVVSEPGCRRMKILKFSNCQEMNDLLLEQKSIDEIEVSIQDSEITAFKQEYATSGMKTKNGNLQELTSANVIQSTASELLDSISHERPSLENTVVAVNTDTPSSNEAGSSLQTNEYPRSQEIWPISRPTTRSQCAVPSDDRSLLNPSASTPYQSRLSKDGGIDSEITFYPEVKNEIVPNGIEDDFNITIIPVGDSVVQISHDSGSTTSNIVQSEHNAYSTFSSPQIMPQTRLINSDQCFPSQSDRSASTCTSVQSNCITQLDNENETSQKKSQTYVQIQQPFHQTTKKSAYLSSEETMESVVPKNASDIETIITALEEELKKTGEQITSISVQQPLVEESPGQGMTYIDEHGHPVEIVQGDGVLEIQGDVENIVWANDQMEMVHEEQVDQTVAVVELDEAKTPKSSYDVVECKDSVERKFKRGRRKKQEVNSTSGTDLNRTCPICHVVLNYASSMKVHLRTHTGVKPFSCGQCDRNFTTKANRDRHEATHVGLKPFPCDICEKRFTEKRSLKIHMRKHTGERPFTCPVCAKGFRQRITMSNHLACHTGKKAHLCDLCGKAFRQKSQLEVHVKRHKRAAAFPCSECSTKCYSKGDLTRHMIKHTGERPFKCQLCPRAFTRKQYLIDHENQHYGRTPYHCSECSAAFHDMASCYRHLKKHNVEGDENKEASKSKKNPRKESRLKPEDIHNALVKAKAGEVIALKNGTFAYLKAVTKENDGSTVYHISGVKDKDISDIVTSNRSENKPAPAPSLRETNPIQPPLSSPSLSSSPSSSSQVLPPQPLLSPHAPPLSSPSSLSTSKAMTSSLATSRPKRSPKPVSKLSE